MTTTLTRRSILHVPAGLAAAAALGALPARLARAAPSAPAEPGWAPGDHVRIGANENPYGPSEATRQALRDAIPDCWKYVLAEDQELRRLIAAKEGLTPQHVMLGEGSTEVLRVAALMNGLSKGEVITASPTFAMVRDYSKGLDVPVQEVPLDASLRVDLAAMRAKFSPATRLVYVCNPNNPTGTRLPGAQVRDFVAALPKDVLAIVDEAYLDIADDAAEHSAVARVAAGDNVIVTRTFSKLHGMAGLRVGYGLARPDITKRLEGLRITLPSYPGIQAALASYQDSAYQALSRSRIAEARKITVAMIEELGMRHTGSLANFVFFDTGKPFAEFSQAMQKKNFHIGRPFPPYLTWARVSMGTVAQMRGFAAAAREHFRA